VCYFSDFIFKGKKKPQKIIIEMKISASHYQRDWTKKKPAGKLRKKQTVFV
jgi:hypothetical protein